MARKRKVIRATRSPLNSQQWSLDLDCGHEVWFSGKRPPRTTACQARVG